MNWIDLVILGILGVNVVAGLFRGAVRTVLGFAGVIFGFIVASRESGAVGLVLAKWMREDLAAVLGFVFVFAGIAIVFGLAGWLLRTFLVKIFLGWVDRSLGVLLGIVKAAIIVGVMALAVEAVGLLPARHESVTYPYALEAGRILLRWIPENTIHRLHLDGLRDRVGESELI